MKDKSLVAICDVLGFGRRVKDIPFKEAVEYVEQIQDLQNKCITKMAVKDGGEIKYRDIVGGAYFSDTILYYCLEDNERAYRHLILAAVALLAMPILWPQFRFRIGISYGDFHHDTKKNIYVGASIVEAYELEKSQEWCGGALTRSAADKVKETDIGKYYLTEYLVPFKNDKRELYHAINWTVAKHQPIDQTNIFERSYGIPLIREQEKIELKLSNTEKFHFEECVQCRAYRNYLLKSK